MCARPHDSAVPVLHQAPQGPVLYAQPPWPNVLCVSRLRLQVAAEQLISATGADPTLVPLAASYMRIRALAQPAVLVTMASQGGLLAQRVSGNASMSDRGVKKCMPGQSSSCQRSPTCC